MIATAAVSRMIATAVYRSDCFPMDSCCFVHSSVYHGDCCILQRLLVTIKIAVHRSHSCLSFEKNHCSCLPCGTIATAVYRSGFCFRMSSKCSLFTIATVASCSQRCSRFASAVCRIECCSPYDGNCSGLPSLVLLIVATAVCHRQRLLFTIMIDMIP